VNIGGRNEMKKILIIVFLASILLLAPMTTAVNKVEISDKNSNDEVPEIHITNDDRGKINLFIENNFQGEDKNQAYSIRDEIIKPTEKEDEFNIDLIALADAIQEYGFQEIPEEELNETYDIAQQQGLQAACDYLNSLIQEYWHIINGELIKDLFGQLVDKIIELIINRLGWLYEFFDRSVNLFVDGVNLVVDYIKPILVIIVVSVVKVINDLLAIPQLFSNLIKLLFEQEFQQFIDTTIAFTTEFADDLVALVEEIKSLVTDQTILNYLDDVEKYFTWLDGAPWTENIEVSGVVKKNFAVFAGATVTCRGQSTITDSNGRYSMSVEVIPSNDSFPPNVYYGMHNCQITVSYNGNIWKQTPRILSYCFSGGEIVWPFFVVKIKPKYINLREIMMERFNNLLYRFQELFPNLFTNINRLSV
jgi:hypothetical protein